MMFLNRSLVFQIHDLHWDTIRTPNKKIVGPQNVQQFSLYKKVNACYNSSNQLMTQCINLKGLYPWESVTRDSDVFEYAHQYQWIGHGLTAAANTKPQANHVYIVFWNTYTSRIGYGQHCISKDIWCKGRFI